MSYGFKIMVKGDYAAFNRPEMKVERVSYDVPTPGALEGLIKSVYWKPAIRYVIDKIIVFNPITFINVRRNEVKEKIKLQSVQKSMKNGTGDATIYTKDMINQRGSMILKDVCYGVEFHFELTGIQSDHDDESEEKHYNILLRRLRNGQQFRQPALENVSDTLKGDTDLGFMLYHMKFEDGGHPKDNDWDKRNFSDKADALFYRPHMIDGVIDVAKYREMMKC